MWTLKMFLYSFIHVFIMLFICCYMHGWRIYFYMTFIRFHLLSYAFIHFMYAFYAFICSSYAFICFHTLSYAFIRFHMLSYAFIPIIYALIRFYMHSTCYNMLLKAKVSQQQEEEMMLALCITGFCFAEAGKKYLFICKFPTINYGPSERRVEG